MAQQLKYFNDLQIKYKILDKSFFKRVLKFGIPMGLSSIVISLMQVIDKIFVGQAGHLDGTIGNYALGATFVSTWYYQLILMVIMGFSSMVSVFTTQNFGAKNYQKVEQGIRLSLTFGLIVAITSVIFAWSMPSNITSLLSSTKDSDNPLIANANLKYGPDYLKVMSFSLISYVLTNQVIQFYSWNEKTKLVLVFTVFALGLNALFDYLFMFTFNMGVVGCAWSTLVVQISLFIMLITKLIMAKNWKGKFNFFKNIFNYSWNVTKQVLNKFLLFFNQISFTTIITVSNILLARVYIEGPTIQGIISPFQSFFMVAMSGVLATTGTIVGKNLGKSQFEEAYANSIRITIYAIAVALVGAIIFVGFSPVIPLAFSAGRNNHEIARQSQIVIIFVSITYCIWIWAMGYGMALRAGGKSFYYTITSTGSALIDLLIILLIFFIRPDFEYWMAFGLWKSTRFLRVGVSYYFYRKQTWIKNLVKK